MDRASVRKHVLFALADQSRAAVVAATEVLLDYVDAQGGPTVVVGESEAMALFKTFVRDNAKALRLVAHWGDGECGALHEVLLNELQGKSLFGDVPDRLDGVCHGKGMTEEGQMPLQPRGLAPLFAEDGGIDQ